MKPFRYLTLLFLFTFVQASISCESTYVALGLRAAIPSVPVETKDSLYRLANLPTETRKNAISALSAQEAFDLLSKAMRTSLALHSSGGDTLPTWAHPPYEKLQEQYPWLKGVSDSSLSPAVKDGFSREWVQQQIREAGKDLADHIVATAPDRVRAQMAKRLIEEVYELPPDWYPQTRADQVIDRILDLRAEEVTQRLQEKSRAEIGAKYGEEETWFEYGNGWLLTPSFEFRLLLDHLKPKPGQTLVDLGSGLGRQGLYMGLMHPDVNFHGYEIVTERVEEGKRVAKKLGLDSVHFHETNMADPHWKPEPADFYYAFNPVSGATFDKILLDLH